VEAPVGWRRAVGATDGHDGRARRAARRTGATSGATDGRDEQPTDARDEWQGQIIFFSKCS
jgi:hypothetical protein